MYRNKKSFMKFDESSTRRCMRYFIGNRCHVESQIAHTAGEVVDVIRNHDGVPVCVKIDTGRGYCDYLEMSLIDFYEPYTRENYYTYHDELEFRTPRISKSEADAV